MTIGWEYGGGLSDLISFLIAHILEFTTWNTPIFLAYAIRDQ